MSLRDAPQLVTEGWAVGVSGLFSIPPLMAKFRGVVDGFSALMRTVLAETLTCR